MSVANILPGHALTVAAPDSESLPEIMAYAAAARRGDVLPVCMRLATARTDAEWALRAQLVRHVGPECEPNALDRACAFMPDAPEPRLLRAARSTSIAGGATCPQMRGAWLAFAHFDLLEATRLDAMDPTARGMLAELVGARRPVGEAAYTPCAA